MQQQKSVSQSQYLFGQKSSGSATQAAVEKRRAAKLKAKNPFGDILNAAGPSMSDQEGQWDDASSRRSAKSAKRYSAFQDIYGQFPQTSLHGLQEVDELSSPRSGDHTMKSPTESPEQIQQKAVTSKKTGKPIIINYVETKHEDPDKFGGLDNEDDKAGSHFV